jgi:hypothetical protein
LFDRLVSSYSRILTKLLDDEGKLIDENNPLIIHKGDLTVVTLLVFKVVDIVFELSLRKLWEETHGFDIEGLNLLEFQLLEHLSALQNKSYQLSSFNGIERLSLNLNVLTDIFIRLLVIHQIFLSSWIRVSSCCF